jgi:hypothetical protein
MDRSVTLYKLKCGAKANFIWCNVPIFQHYFFSTVEDGSNNCRTCIPSFSEIREQLDQGATVLSLKKEIIGAMKEMRKMGYDSSRIADFLYEAGIKTMKGKKRWESGTIRKWWK